MGESERSKQVRVLQAAGKFKGNEAAFMDDREVGKMYAAHVKRQGAKRGRRRGRR